MPLTCNGRSVGVLLVTRREAGSLNDEIVSLLERMSANISYALDNFDREAARKSGERAMRRLNRMFGALSATNEAILRAKTERNSTSWFAMPPFTVRKVQFHDRGAWPSRTPNFFEVVAGTGRMRTR